MEMEPNTQHLDIDNVPPKALNLLELKTLTPPLGWAEFFGNENPVELEVGPGKGLFLANAAVRQPGHNFVGIELARKYARKAADRITKRGLTNVRVLVGDARQMLREFIPQNSLHAVHVYFPDPWWKKRHKKRRVFNESLLQDIKRALITNGDLFLVTDVEEYFEVMTQLVATQPAFQLLPPPEPNTPEHDLDYLTNFERKFRIEGRPIYRVHYRLTHKAKLDD